MNPAWTAVTGWSRQETVGKTLVDFAHPEEAEITSGTIRDLQTTGKASAEHRLRAKSGEWLWFRSRSTRPGAGAALIVSQHVTEERRRATEGEDALRASELLRAATGVFLWRFCPMTMSYVIDPDLAGAPDARTRIVTAEQMREEVHPDDRERTAAALAATLETGEQQSIEYRHWYPEGKLWATLRAAWRGVRRSPNGQWEVLGITHDMTEVAWARDAARRG